MYPFGVTPSGRAVKETDVSGQQSVSPGLDGLSPFSQRATCLKIKNNWLLQERAFISIIAFYVFT